MSMTFGFTFKKLKSAEVGRIKNHNLRLHRTASQLENKAAWFSPEGHETIVDWDDSRIEAARALSTRKDAVVAVAFSIQLGAQMDWREYPTEAFPEGKPKPNGKAFDLICSGAKQWAIEAFGEENLVSVELHTDESTPHVQFVVTPIFEGKLQAKHWLNGGSTCAKLRRTACDVMNRYIACHYVPGNSGGEPHDPGKAAGNTAPEEKPSMMDKLFKSREKELHQEILALNNKVRELEQALFSRQKTHYLKHKIVGLEAANLDLTQKLKDKTEELKSLEKEHDQRFDVVRKGVKRLKELEAKADFESKRADQLSQEVEALALKLQALSPMPDTGRDAPLPLSNKVKPLKPS